MSEIEAFTIAATDEQLADLRQRLSNTRWPEAELVEDWTQGIPLSYVQEVCEYWAKDYDWRVREALLNRFRPFPHPGRRPRYSLHPPAQPPSRGPAAVDHPRLARVDS